MPVLKGLVEGDRIKCLDNAGWYNFKVGEIYTFIEYDREYMQIEYVTRHGEVRSGGFNSPTWELVETPETEFEKALRLVRQSGLYEITPVKHYIDEGDIVVVPAGTVVKKNWGDEVVLVADTTFITNVKTEVKKV